MNQLILLRGLPGAGKSTLADIICDRHVEADVFFIDKKTGEYKFDASKLKQAHKWCVKMVKEIMDEDEGYNIAVSNTFTQEWEMEAYYKLAKEYDYRVHSIIVENRHNGVNKHNVPDEKIEQMKNRFQIKL